MLASVQNSVASKRLLPKGSRVIVALSGGPDSVALLHLLSRLARPDSLELFAVYINHGLRKKAAREEEAFCRRLCDKLGIELTIVREDVRSIAKTQKLSIEEAGRNLRYEVFERLAAELGCDRVALGHHADDQVETILFRLLRGTGPSGLSGMPALRDIFVRPMLDISRADILAYLRRHRLDWCEDASNRSLKYTRNAIRHKLLPLAEKIVNPRTGDAVLAMADSLRADESYLESVVDDLWRRAARFTPGGKLNLDLTMLRDYHKAICRRLLRRCVRMACGVGSGPDKDVIDRLLALSRTESGRLALPQRLQAEIAGGRLWLSCPSPGFQSGELVVGRELRLSWPRLSFRAREIEATGGLGRIGRQSIVLDRDKVRLPLTVRGLAPGDRFRPLGLNGSKKVSDLLTDRKVPRPLRDELPIVCDKQGIIWVVGSEIAHRVRVTSATKGVLRVEYRVRQKS